MPLSRRGFTATLLAAPAAYALSDTTTLAAAGPLAVDPGDIPAANLPPAGWQPVFFQDPGGWQTLDVTQHGLPANDSSVDASAAVRALLAATSGRRVLYFPAGTYHFKTGLSITTGDIILRGAGLSRTTLLIDAPGASNAELRFDGKLDATPVAVSGPVNPGATQVTVASTAGLAVGDIVHVHLAGGRIAWSVPTEGQLFRITAISGNTITLDMKNGLYLPADKTPRLRKVGVIRNVGVEKLRIERTQAPTEENVNNLVFRCTQNAYVIDIESVKSGRGHIAMEWTRDGYISRNYTHDAFVKNVGGYAYGICAHNASTRVYICDNKTWDLRHHIILQIGANHCVVAYNSVETPYLSYNDMALHANYAFMNLFEGNRFREGYADNSKSDPVMSATGPYNTWFRNHADGPVGSINADTRRQNVIGNIAGEVALTGTLNWDGANLVGGTADWGNLNSGSTIPASLYTSGRPTFLADKTWPVYGPGLSGWGASTTLPATDRARP
ncbi:hypothetical protein ACXZ65_36425 [Streptomyces aculeolatus]